MIIEAIVIGRTTALGPCRVWDFMTLPHPISDIPTARQLARSQGRAAKHALFLRTKPRPVNSASKTTEIFGRNRHETQRTPVVIQLGDMDDQRDERHLMAGILQRRPSPTPQVIATAATATLLTMRRQRNSGS